MGLLYSNYECNPTSNTNINAVSGTLIKTYKDSYFLTTEFDSYLAKGLFDKEKPNLGYCRGYGYERGREVIILQIMLCGNKKILIEVINKEDYDKMFKVLGDEKNDKDN